jgi:hypothetical protein
MKALIIVARESMLGELEGSVPPVSLALGPLSQLHHR